LNISAKNHRNRSL